MSKNDLGTAIEEPELEESLVAEHINDGNSDDIKSMITKYQTKIKELYFLI